MKLKLLLLTIAFSATAIIARANNDTEGNKKNDIAGGVIAYSSSKKEKTVQTDGNGNYSFSDLKPGTYKLVFEKDGYKKVTKDKVVIRSDEGCQLNVEMDENDNFQILPGLLFTDFD